MAYKRRLWLFIQYKHILCGFRFGERWCYSHSYNWLSYNLKNNLFKFTSQMKEDVLFVWLNLSYAKQVCVYSYLQVCYNSRELLEKAITANLD